MSNNWSFAQVWNQALDKDRQREIVPRDYTYASELGKGYYDRYWKMKGRKPTTPPGMRAQRKFEAGNLVEWVMQQVLARAGVLQSTQERMEDTSGPIRVSGRCDFMAGGKVQEINLLDLGLPETFADVAEMAIKNLKEKYPDGLREQGLEIKSCAGVMFDRYLKAPSLHHALQSFFYASQSNMPYTLVYVSRDDLRVCEWTIMPDSEAWGELYDKDLAGLAKALELTEEEALVELKEPLLSWDEELKRFSKNWEVEYSSYLTDYGYDRPDEYKKPAGSFATRLNNIVKKIKEGKPIDGKVNQKTLEEAYAFYPGAEEIINRMKEQYEIE